jgi:RNA polymerase sigma-70 factor (ECF subfamily)
LTSSWASSGESKFTIWAYKFVVFEVSGKIGQHCRNHPAMPMNAEDWERLPDGFGLDPAREAEPRELSDAVGHAADEVLTPRQRQVFVAIVLNGAPWKPWSPGRVRAVWRGI